MQLTPATDRFVVPDTWPSAWVVAIVSVTMLAVFAPDRSTGAAPVQHLYYLPVILAGFRFQMRGGVIAGLSTIVLSRLANPHLLTIRYGESDLLQIALFLAVGVISARMSRDARRLQMLAATDDLTGLHNLRSFEGHLARMVRAARERRTRLTLLVLDVDRLKALNDCYGHVTGAEAVRTVGHLIAERLPPDAVVPVWRGRVCDCGAAWRPARGTATGRGSVSHRPQLRADARRPGVRCGHAVDRRRRGQRRVRFR